MAQDTITCISFPRIELDNGFFAEGNGGYWYIYHTDNPRQCVWTVCEKGEARNYARLPQLQQFAAEHNVRSAIEADSLVIYLETSWSTPFGPQSGITSVRVKTLRELKTELGY